MEPPDGFEATKVGRKARLASTPAGNAAEPVPGRPLRIGPFRILDLLGEGGMGTVYLAEQQEPVVRQVALKVMRTVLADGAAGFRFAQERQALARLSHRCIAKLYEAGTTPDGSPWFAMELVEGLPITEYADRQALGPRDRIELLRQVCAGVQHAHQKGLLHRDLKPSNLLVAQEGEVALPKIIDFGIATAVDAPQEGHLAGTPAYMSPEAFEPGLDLDTRADVYSLGVVLHELLAGVRPRGGSSSFTEARRSQAGTIVVWPGPWEAWAGLDAAARVEVARRRGLTPVRLGRLLRGDLAWVLRKALAPDRDQRYGSPAELGADLGHLLAGEAVGARPATLGYRLRCGVRRHRGLVGAAALLFLVLGAGLWARTREARRATREARRAEAQERLARQEAGRADLATRRAEAEAVVAQDQAAEARRQAARAEAQTRLAEDRRGLALAAQEKAQLEKRTAEEVATFLTGLFKVSTPSEALGSSITAKEVMDKGAARIEKELAGQPALQARLMHSLGGAYIQMGLYKQADPLLRRTLEVLRTLKDPARDELAATLGDLGALAYYRSDFPASERYYRESLEVWRTYPELTDAILANALKSLSNPLLRQEKTGEAEPVLQEALRVLQRGKGDPRALSGLHASLGGLHYYRQRYPEALSSFQEAYRLRVQAVGSERHPELIPMLNNLDHIARAAGRWEEAEGYRRKVIDYSRAFLGERHPDTAQALHEAGGLLARKEDWKGLAETVGLALDIRKEALGPRNAATGKSRQVLGTALMRLGRHAEAQPLLVEMTTIEREEKRTGTGEFRVALMELGRCRRVLHDPQGARSAFQEVLPLLRAKERTEGALYLECLRSLAQLAQEAHAEEEAGRHLQELREAAARLGLKEDGTRLKDPVKDPAKDHAKAPAK